MTIMTMMENAVEAVLGVPSWLSNHYEDDYDDYDDYGENYHYLIFYPLKDTLESTVK